MSILDSPINNDNSSTVKSKGFVSNKKVIIFLLFLIVAIIATATTVLYFRKVKQSDLTKAISNNLSPQEEVKLLVQKVGLLIYLPEGETPTLATVSDADRVRSQVFFANTQNGDKVLIYQAAKKAYLYRPSENKIIEVGVVNVDQGETSNTNTTNEVDIQPLPKTAPSGKGVISAGQSEVVVTNPSIKKDSLILTTPTTGTGNYTLYIKEQEDGQFTVGFDLPTEIDIGFNWWITEVGQ